MKKIFMMLPLFAAILMTGCTNDDFAANEPSLPTCGATTITATIADEGTETVLGENGKVEWQAGDVIRLVQMVGGEPVVADYVAQSGGSNVSLFKLADGQTAVDPAQSTAYYPASLYDIAQKSAVLPENQTFAVVDGKPVFENAPMFAEGNDVNLLFKNICSVLKVNVTVKDTTGTMTAKIRSIRISSEKAMSGRITITDNKAMTVETEPLPVYLNCGDTVVDGVNGVDFYVAVPVNAECNRLAITVTNNNNYRYTRRAKEGIVMERNNIYPVSLVADFTPSTEVVDLGLSVLWASRNVGAQNPWDFGDYFAWAATEPLYNSLELEAKNIKKYKLEGVEWTIKSIDWKPEKDPVATLPGYTQKNAPYSKGYIEGLGYSKYTSINAVLEAMDDAATVNWKGSWRMPTYMEWTELFRNCVQEKVLNYHGTNVSGVIFYKAKGKDLDWIKHPTSTIDHGPTVDIDGVQWLWPGAKETYSEEEDNHIFLPAAGRIEGQTLKYAGTLDVLANAAVHMWSANLYSNYLQGAHASIAAMSFLINDNRVRGTGMTIRPCMPRQE
ncbi:MAG: hypothetical protein Q3994_02140 [Prevotella sp.]|nr:hypothetical protein [Prevotella sp.]